MTEKFRSHVHLRSSVSFVKNTVDLYDLLDEYLTLESESSDELKTFYLNEILVSQKKFKLKQNLKFSYIRIFMVISNDMIFM